jgi:hypothetical protein
MKLTLRVLALVVALGATGWWLAAGANRGWTKNSSIVKVRDEVTGIEQISYEKKLIPGIEFLGVALLGSGIVAGASLFFRKQPKTN